MKALWIVIFALLVSCAANAAPDLPTGPAELLVRVESHETRAVYFAVEHSWEDLEAHISGPLRGKNYGIEALELDTAPGAGAPWIKPVPGGLPPSNGCLRVVQP